MFVHTDREDGNIDNDDFPAGGGRWMLERRLRGSAPSGIILGGEVSGFVTTLDERHYIHLVTSSLVYVLDSCGRIYPLHLLENYAVWPGQSSKVDWTVVDVLTAGQGKNTSELTAVQNRTCIFVGVLVKHVLITALSFNLLFVSYIFVL